MLLTLTLQLVHCLQRCFCLYSDGVYLVRAIIQNLLYLSSFFFFIVLVSERVCIVESFCIEFV